jgi:predicted Zn finger-like uncharacterized protein
MIITCNKCSTSFTLDDSFVKAEGSKVRCSICKHIFTAYPLPPEPEHVPEALSGLHLESDSDMRDTVEDPSDFEMDDEDFSLKEFDLAIESDDLELDDTDFDPEASDLDIDDNLSFETTKFEVDKGEGESLEELELTESPLAFEEDDIGFKDISEDDFDSLEFEPIEFEPIEDEPVSLDRETNESTLTMEEEIGEPIFDEDEFEIEFELEDEVEEEIEFELEEGSPDPIDGETEKTSVEIETIPDEENPVLSLADLATEEEAPIITPEDDFSEYDDVLEQETEPEDDFTEEETIEIDDTQEEEKIQVEKPEPLLDIPLRSRRKKKKSLIGAPVLVLLLIFLLVMGAYIVSLVTGYKIPYLSEINIPYVEQYLKKQTPETIEAKPIPNQKSVNGRFITNTTVGTLFVITGRVENPATVDLSHIQVRGALITPRKVEAKINHTFCGNIITEDMLKTGNISDINTQLAVKVGHHNSNVNVKPGTSVPFMVVFSDLPEKLQNFTVKVTGFERATGN